MGAPPIAIRAYDSHCARLCGALTHGGSASIGWALLQGQHSSPEVAAAAAPLTRYAREWWLATSPKAAEREAALPTPLIVSAYTEAAAEIAGKKPSWLRCAGDPVALAVWGAA